MLHRVWEEVREVVWLASIVGGLSVLGVAIVVIAVVLGEWHHLPVIGSHV